MNSFMGKVLRVDLSAGTAESVEIPAQVYEAVLAGKGLEAWYLYNNIPAGADPLGGENILAFAAGALCGTGAFLTGRWSVACKSPLTGGWGDANCGGLFAPAIKQCGYDAIFISGAAEEPVYLFCDALRLVRVSPLKAKLLLMSVNGERASLERELHDGDVVGFFFPVSGC